MSFVLDASVVGNWFMPDEAEHADASAAWNLIKNENGRVPPHWWFEVRNFMLVAERKGRFTEHFTTSTLQRLARMNIVQAPRSEDAGIFDLARRHRLSFYDAAYLELAQSENIALATLDRDLVHAARAEGVDLVAGKEHDSSP
jgi:predicted nucleic acid-binding protein